MKFTEAKLEHAFIELLKEEGYKHILGETIIRMPEEVLIEADLKLFLQQFPELVISYSIPDVQYGDTYRTW